MLWIDSVTHGVETVAQTQPMPAMRTFETLAGCRQQDIGQHPRAQKCVRFLMELFGVLSV